jgi:ribosomal protein S18 acetylase RimI-like enzyme
MNDTFPLALSYPDPQTHIRPVRHFDVDTLHRVCWSDRPRQWVFTLVTRAQQQARQGRGFGIVVTGQDTRDIRAYGQLTLWLRAAEISDLMVIAAQRGHGLGTTMIQYLVRAAREMQAKRVEIGASIDNPRALALYRRLGFIDSHQITVQTETAGEETIQYLILDFERYMK